MDRVQKLLKRTLAYENFLKLQLKIIKFEKKGHCFLENEKKNYLRLGPERFPVCSNCCSILECNNFFSSKNAKDKVYVYQVY